MTDQQESREKFETFCKNMRSVGHLLPDQHSLNAEHDDAFAAGDPVQGVARIMSRLYRTPKQTDADEQERLELERITGHPISAADFAAGKPLADAFSALG